MKRVKILHIIFLLLFLIACGKEDKGEVDVTKRSDPNFVDIGVAKAISENLNSFVAGEGQTGGMLLGGSVAHKKVDNVEPFVDEMGNTYFYVINYRGGGFVLLSADNRISPIMAYSKEGSFDIKDIRDNNGVLSWINIASENIFSVRESGQVQKGEIREEWDRVLRPMIVCRDPCECRPLSPECQEQDPENNPPKLRGVCKDTYIEKGPLLETEWGQRGEFNDLLPGSCNNNGKMEQYVAGCVIISTAQIIYHYKKIPSVNDKGMDGIKKLILDVYNVFDWKEEGCDETSVFAFWRSIPELLLRVGFSSAKDHDYKYGMVSKEIGEGRPVILYGFSDKALKKGHVWICDGYAETMYYSSDCKSGWGKSYLHMNWGWGGRYNGWFLLDDFSPENGKNYKYKKGMIIVKP